MLLSFTPSYESAKTSSLGLFFAFLPPLPPSRGLREVLAIWMLLLYCERSLIASVLPTASPTSQHGAWLCALSPTT